MTTPGIEIPLKLPSSRAVAESPSYTDNISKLSSVIKDRKVITGLYPTGAVTYQTQT